MKKQYRIVFEAGGYFPEERVFFMWFRLKTEIDGYSIQRYFDSYKRALGFISVYNKQYHGDKEYRIVM